MAKRIVVVICAVTILNWLTGCLTPEEIERHNRDVERSRAASAALEAEMAVSSAVITVQCNYEGYRLFVDGQESGRFYFGGEDGTIRVPVQAGQHSIVIENPYWSPSTRGSGHRWQGTVTLAAGSVEFVRLTDLSREE